MSYDFPKVLPVGWSVCERTLDGISYQYRPGTIAHKTVIISTAMEQDGNEWIHASIAKPDRLPTWEDLKEMKQIFIGIDREAYQVLPKPEMHVNIHPFCLHLFSRVDGKTVLPDFTQGGKYL